MVIAALSHLNESSMTRTFLNVSSSQSSVGIDYSGLSLTSMDGYGLRSNLHNTAECSGHVDMEVTPQGLYEDSKLWNCFQILGLDEPQSDLNWSLQQIC